MFNTDVDTLWPFTSWQVHRVHFLEAGLSHPKSIVKWLWVKNRYPKWNPSKWKQGPSPAVPWWFNFTICLKSVRTLCVSLLAPHNFNQCLLHKHPTRTTNPRLRKLAGHKEVKAKLDSNSPKVPLRFAIGQPALWHFWNKHQDPSVCQ